MYDSCIICDMAKRLENLLGALALALSDSVSGAVEAGAGHAGATSAALAVLAQEPGLGIEQLKVPLGRTQSATVRIVDQLVAEGLAERREGRDRRSVAVFLTQRGTAAAAAVLERRRAVLNDALSALDGEEQRALEATLVKLLGAMTTDPAQAERICRLCDVAACPLRSCPVEQAVDVASREPGRPGPRPLSGSRESRPPARVKRRRAGRPPASRPMP
jgi:MarR family transcriptional regulator, negative regulator of the multidrug operon emrRAB